MKSQIPKSFLALLLLFGAQSPRLAAQAAAPQRTANDLPATERLVTALPQPNALSLSAAAQNLMEWPTAEMLTLQQARHDRSQSIPPLFRQPKIGDAKPILLGARTPQAAAKEAAQWIRLVLKPQWVPDDLAARLQALQREPASQSLIVCRYSMAGHAIQINQSRGAMCVVIKPPAVSSVLQSTKNPAAAIFTEYFLEGDRMASLHGKEAAGAEKIRIWLPDYSTPIPVGALENWWGWQRWLTDGEAFAVFLNKTSEDSARNILPEDPWF